MDSLRKLCPTEVLSLHPSFGVTYSSFLELTFGYLQLSTPRQMDKPNKQTRHSSNTFAALWTTNRTTSWTYYIKQSLLITTQRMHRPGLVHSSPITVSSQVQPWNSWGLRKPLGWRKGHEAWTGSTEPYGKTQANTRVAKEASRLPTQGPSKLQGWRQGLAS
jgi:hypothetical protein